MSAYQLHTALEQVTPGRGSLTVVTVRHSGQQVPGAAFVHLVCTRHGDFAQVTLRPESRPVNEPDRPADFTFEGLRTFRFESHDAALAFLRHLYGIEPAPAPAQAVEALPIRAPVFSRSVPAPLARDVAPSSLPRPAPGATERAAFYGTAVYPHLHHNDRYDWPTAPCLAARWADADRPGVDVERFHPWQGSAPPAANRNESPIREGRSPTTAGRQCLTIHHPRNTP